MGEKNIETLQLQFIFEPFLRIGCVDCGDACQQNGRIASLIKSIWLTLYVIICHEFNFISNTIDLVGIYLDKSLVNETDLVLKFEFWSRGRHSCWSVANKKSTNTTKVLIKIEMILKSILWGQVSYFSYKLKSKKDILFYIKKVPNCRPSMSHPWVCLVKTQELLC